MIAQRFDQSHPWHKLTALELALSPIEMETVREQAAEADSWRPGRQGSGYYTLDLKEWSWHVAPLRSVQTRLLNAIAKHADAPGVKLQGSNDFHLIYYPEGSGVSMHKDPAPFGARHFRANVAVTSPEFGGELVLPNGCYPSLPMNVKLLPGQGIIFEPSAVEHGVTLAGAGGRLVVSVGAVISD